MHSVLGVKSQGRTSKKPAINPAAPTRLSVWAGPVGRAGSLIGCRRHTLGALLQRVIGWQIRGGPLLHARENATWVMVDPEL